MIVIAPKHVGAVLMSILILLLKQFSCVSVGEKNYEYTFIVNVFIYVLVTEAELLTLIHGNNSDLCIKKEVNVYLPPLMMKVPNHLYVLGDTYTCHTYCCYAYHFNAYWLYFIYV
jgi:hypothetical protein